jgi:hypothetical protein
VCNICYALEKEQLTRKEADSAFREMLLVNGEYAEESEHYLDAGLENLKKMIDESKDEKGN